VWRWALVLLLVGAGVYLARSTGPVDATALGQDAGGPRLRVVVLGEPGDPRVAPAREALAHWNEEFRRLGRRVHFDSGTVRRDSVPDEVLRGASGEAVFARRPATNRLLAALSDVPADVVIALSHTDLISFSVPWRAGSRGVVGIRRSDIPPLSLPNTVRNVIAHELGHVLGLDHNGDSTTLMCGRPASCRPVAFVSDSARFFPLTVADTHRLEARWP
jgi:Matrixin